MAGGSLHQVMGVFKEGARNAQLVRLESAWMAFNGTMWGAWLALIVWAFLHGGAAASSLMVVVQLAPCAILAPLLGALPDRFRPGRVLFFAYLAMAASTAALAGAIAAGAPVWVVYALAPSLTLAASVPRPAQAALLPAIVRTPAELTAGNVLAGWMEALSVMIAPAVTGALIGVGGPALGLGALAALAVCGAVLVVGAPGPRPLGAGAHEGRPSIIGEVRDGIGAVAHDRAARILVLVLGSQFILIGALDIIYVVLAMSVLGMGESGSGYLTSAFGLGGLIGAGLTALLIARRRIAPALVGSLVVVAISLGALGLYPTVVSAFALLAVAGISRTALDVTGRILLQRSVAPGLIAKVFGLLESLMDVGLLLGAILVPVLVGASGAEAALIGLGILFAVIAVATLRGLWSVDAAATVPLVEINLLHTIPLFAPLPPQALEGLARALVPRHAPAGETLVLEGDFGGDYFAVAGGEVTVTHAGREVARLGRGEGFGEIALLHDVPRAATVTAVTAVDLFSLAKEPFIATLTQQEAAAELAAGVVAERLAGLRAAEGAVVET